MYHVRVDQAMEQFRKQLASIIAVKGRYTKQLSSHLQQKTARWNNHYHFISETVRLLDLIKKRIFHFLRITR